MTSSAPVIVGTGLICLDALLINEEEAPQLFAGGTALNTLVHLHLRGWQTYLFGLIGEDRAGEYVLRDLRELDFSTEGIRVDAAIRTPVYVERIKEDKHRFLRDCPQCGKPFPPCPEPSAEQMNAFIATLPDQVDYCIIERANPTTLELARACIERGASLYLELNRPGNNASCRELLDLATVFKIAYDRRPHFAFLENYSPAPLEIETRGAEGIRYRFGGDDWRTQSATSCPNFIDAAGAGDAFSAELIAAFAEYDEPLTQWTETQLKNTLRRAQDAAALNCRFAGPRGAMYQHRLHLRADDYCCGSKSAYPPRLDALPAFHERRFSLPIDCETTLSLLREENAHELFSLVDDNRDYLREWMPWVDEASQPEGVHRFICFALERFQYNEEMHFAILHHGRIMGVIGTHRIDWENRRASLGYWVDRRRQGMGLVTRSVRALTDFLFRKLDMHRVEIRCTPQNHRSRAIPKRLGFQQEGVLRDAQRLYGKYHDLVIYACLRDEWVERG